MLLCAVTKKKHNATRYNKHTNPDSGRKNYPGAIVDRISFVSNSFQTKKPHQSNQRYEKEIPFEKQKIVIVRCDVKYFSSQKSDPDLCLNIYPPTSRRYHKDGDTKSFS